jgi:ElaB/YqjD/DUF883 family membrane-anchored ribosome-binding protein
MAATEAKADRAGESSAHEQIRELREQVEALMRDRITPAVTDAIDRAGDAVHRVGDMAHDKREALSKNVREQPLTSILIAAAVGYIIGRLTR